MLEPEVKDSTGLVSAIKALLDHLASQPKHAQLDALWRDTRAELDKFTGTQTPAGRVAGDEHPGYRQGDAPDASLAGQHNPGGDAIEKDKKGKGWKPKA